MRLTTGTGTGRRVAAAGGVRQSALWGKGGRGTIATLVAVVGVASFTGVAAAANDTAAGSVAKAGHRTVHGKQLGKSKLRPVAAWSSGKRDVTPPPAAWSTLPR